MARKLTCPTCKGKRIQVGIEIGGQRVARCTDCNWVTLICLYEPCSKPFKPKRAWVNQKYHKPICQARDANDRHYAKRKRAMELLREKEKNSLDA